MCNCVEQIKEDKERVIATHLKQKQNLTLEKIDFKDITFGWKNKGDGKAEMWTRTSSQVQLTVTERKRPVDQTMVHSFCPFCGEKYDK